MKSIEIWWEDLTIEAQERLIDLYHDNIDIVPVAIIDIEEDDNLEDEIITDDEPDIPHMSLNEEE